MEKSKKMMAVLERYSHNEKYYDIINLSKRCMNPCLFLSNKKCLNKHIEPEYYLTDWN